VEIKDIRLDTPEGPVITVAGADLMDGTPIFDIKPYYPMTESVPEARGGFASAVAYKSLEVNIPPELMAKVPEDKRRALIGVLSQDPRPHYQKDPERVYGMRFADFNVKFTVDGDTLTVTDIDIA
jgi:hypothetical protein